MKFEDLVHKVLHEPGFYSQLKDNPEKALKNAGVTPKPEMVQALKAIDYDSLKRVAHAADTNVGIC
jgi:hypothetical protein